MGEEYVLVELHAPARATRNPELATDDLGYRGRQLLAPGHVIDPRARILSRHQGARSATTLATPVGEPWESVTSDQPTSPSSVVAFTKSHGLHPASQVTVSRRANFTPGKDIRGRTLHSAAGPRVRPTARPEPRSRRRRCVRDGDAAADRQQSPRSAAMAPNVARATASYYGIIRT